MARFAAGAARLVAGDARLDPGMAAFGAGFDRPLPGLASGIAGVSTAV